MTTHHYDLIIVDAYSSDAIPIHLATREAMAVYKSKLAPGGIVAANTFSASRLYDSESVTYRSVFGQFYNLRSVNRVILASNAELPSLAQAAQNSQRFVATFKPLGFTPQSVLSRFSTSSDWNAGARVLTDQYSPANLLNWYITFGCTNAIGSARSGVASMSSITATNRSLK